MSCKDNKIPLINIISLSLCQRKHTYMQEKELKISYSILNIEELNSQEKELISKARKAVEGSYSPYSCFRVGAAVLLDNGKIVKGANQENVAYPSGLCAERVCMFTAKSENPNSEIIALAITSQNQRGERQETFPCGACLQVAAEYERGQKNKLHLLVQKNEDEVYFFESVRCLLPFAFNL